MLIHSDWHIHSEYSYDAKTPIEQIAENAKKQGLRHVGVTDHVNFNDKSFLGDLRRSAAAVKEAKKIHPFMILGVELTPIEKPEFGHIAKTGTREGYVAPLQSTPYDLELAATKEELIALGVQYAVGASHWRLDVPKAVRDATDVNACIKEWYRQQLWLACDERVTILGHPWENGRAIWYEDFSVIPHSMSMEIAAALKENGKYVECNSCFFRNDQATERFRHQYADFLRELHEMGIPVTYGSDAHNSYGDARQVVSNYLAAAGFVDGDVVELSESVLWC